MPGNIKLLGNYETHVMKCDKALWVLMERITGMRRAGMKGETFSFVYYPNVEKLEVYAKNQVCLMGIGIYFMCMELNSTLWSHKILVFLTNATF